MGDASRQPADCFHLLCLAELLLQGSVLGDIFGKQLERGGVFLVANSSSREPQDRTAAVSAQKVRNQAGEILAVSEGVRQLEPSLGTAVERSEEPPDYFRGGPVSPHLK